MMMFYRRRASPKHCYSIIEVDYGGGGHRTRLKDQQINCCVFGVPPAPVYKGAKGGEAAGQERGAPGGVLLPPGVGLPPFLVGLGEEREGERGKGKWGPAPLLVQFGLGGRGVRLPLGRLSSSTNWAHEAQ